MLQHAAVVWFAPRSWLPCCTLDWPHAAKKDTLVPHNLQPTNQHTAAIFAIQHGRCVNVASSSFPLRLPPSSRPHLLIPSSRGGFHCDFEVCFIGCSAVAAGVVWAVCDDAAVSALHFPSFFRNRPCCLLSSCEPSNFISNSFLYPLFLPSRRRQLKKQGNV